MLPHLGASYCLIGGKVRHVAYKVCMIGGKVHHVAYKVCMIGGKVHHVAFKVYSLCSNGHPDSEKGHRFADWEAYPQSNMPCITMKIVFALSAACSLQASYLACLVIIFELSARRIKLQACPHTPRHDDEGPKGTVRVIAFTVVLFGLAIIIMWRITCSTCARMQCKRVARVQHVVCTSSLAWILFCSPWCSVLLVWYRSSAAHCIAQNC